MIMHEEEILKAEKRISYAVVAGAIITTFILALSIIGMYNENVRFRLGVDEWSLLDALLIGLLTFGIYRRNRFAAVAMAVYFALSKIVEIVSKGEFSGGLLISFAILYVLISGAISIFKLRKHGIATGEIVIEEGKKSTSYYLLISLAGIFIIGFFSLAVVGYMSPEIEVIPGRQLKKKYVEFSVENNLIGSEETIHFWYSDAMVDFKDGFYFFTDEKVVLYSQEWQEPSIIISIAEIDDMDFDHQPDWIEDSYITLYLKDETLVGFPLSSDNEGDKRFYEKLLDVWNETKRETSESL